MGGSSFVKITDNKFSNLYHSQQEQHGDVIQLFTDDTTSAGHRHYDYLVTCSLADPVSPTQGIFIQDELGTFPILQYGY